MKNNLKLYVEIEEYVYNQNIYYSVLFITEYDKSFLGIDCGHKKLTTKVPFIFKTFEIAKDFCEINPNYNSIWITNSDYDDKEVNYYTYKIETNNNVCYIKWEDDIIHESTDYNVSFYPEDIQLVDAFVKKIKLKNWMDTFDLYDVKFDNKHNLLSELINEYTIGKKWKFELVKNN